jgi:hypothetical protein
MCQQCDILRASVYIPEDDLCETETSRVVVDERHGIGMTKPGIDIKLF